MHFLTEGTRPPIKYTSQKTLSLNQIKLLDLSTGYWKHRGWRPRLPQGDSQQNPECGKLYGTSEPVSFTNKKEIEGKRGYGNLLIKRDSY